MSSLTIVIILATIALLPFLLLIVGLLIYRAIKKEQQVQSTIPLASSAESDNDGRKISNKLRKEKLRSELS